MAAAEYYNPGGTPQGPPQGPPPAPMSVPQMQQQPTLRPNPNQSQSNLTPPYPLTDGPPPPYSSEQQRPHSQPPPQQRIPQPNGGPYTPYQPPNMNTHQYPHEKAPQRPSTLQNMYRPSDFIPSHPPQQQPPGGYFTPVAPGLGSMSQVYGNQQKPPRRSSMSGYPSGGDDQNRQSSSRSPSHTRRHHHKPKPELQRKKSSGVNTFLGAGGGAIIGDLIFPGLGTIGGALLGTCSDPRNFTYLMLTSYQAVSVVTSTAKSERKATRTEQDTGGPIVIMVTTTRMDTEGATMTTIGGAGSDGYYDDEESDAQCMI